MAAVNFRDSYRCHALSFTLVGVVCLGGVKVAWSRRMENVARPYAVEARQNQGRLAKHAWVAAVVRSASMRLTPAARALPPTAARCCTPACVATSADEHAVSMLTDGPARRDPQACKRPNYVNLGVQAQTIAVLTPASGDAGRCRLDCDPLSIQASKLLVYFWNDTGEA